MNPDNYHKEMKQLNEDAEDLRKALQEQAHLIACCEQSSKLEKDILKTAEPYVDKPEGAGYDSHYAWEVIKKQLQEPKQENEDE
jgi:hypothetical protein